MKKQRLLRLAKHLESGKLIHKKFDYTIYNSGDFFNKSIKCGTSGCALGECPAIFKGWGFEYRSGVPVFDNKIDPATSAMEFFGLDIDEFEFLFVPRALESNNPLGCDATREQVAKHIKKFVKHGGIYT